MIDFTNFTLPGRVRLLQETRGTYHAEGRRWADHVFLKPGAVGEAFSRCEGKRTKKLVVLLDEKFNGHTVLAWVRVEKLEEIKKEVL